MRGLDKVSESSANRLLGIDFIKIIAAFGVIAIHAGLVVDGRVDESAKNLSYFFSFVVPFFVVASLALNINGRFLPWRAWWLKNAKRLLLPYLAWAIIYLCLRLIRYSSDPAQALTDPVGLLLFNGGGSIALYFIPMLFAGAMIARLILPIIEYVRQNIFLILLMCCLAYAFLIFQISTNNAYSLNFSKAFLTSFPNQENPFLRVALVLASHVIFCLPHLFFSLIGLYLFRFKKIGAMLFVGILLFFVPMFLSGKMPVFSHIRGDGAFLIALGIAPYLFQLAAKYQKWVIQMASYSFGIYLSHQVVLQFFQIVSRKLIPSSFVMGHGAALLQTTIVFLILCFVIHSLSMKSEFLSKLFAVK